MCELNLDTKPCAPIEKEDPEYKNNIMEEGSVENDNNTEEKIDTESTKKKNNNRKIKLNEKWTHEGRIFQKKPAHR